MNVKQLAKQVGACFRFRPLPIRVDTDGNRLQPVDDAWQLESVDDHPGRVRLANIATGHVLELEADNIQERRSPDFLMLRCQLTIRPSRIDIEPIHKGAPIAQLDATTAKRIADAEARAQAAEERARALEEDQRPRSLIRESSNRLIEILKLLPKGSVEILCPRGNEEACIFAQEIKYALQQAGWAISRFYPEDFVPSSMGGVLIEVYHPGREIPDKAKYLFDALCRAGIAHSMRSTHSHSSELIQIKVLKKPAKQP